MFIVDRGYGGSVLLAAGLILGLAFAGHRQFGTPLGCGAKSGWVIGSDDQHAPFTLCRFCQSSRQQVLRDADDAAGPIRQLAIGSLRLQCGG